MAFEMTFSTLRDLTDERDVLPFCENALQQLAYSNKNYFNSVEQCWSGVFIVD